MQDYITAEISRSADLVSALAGAIGLRQSLEAAARACASCLEGGGTVLFAGNGGSAAEAQHFAAELVSRFAFDRDALPAQALTTDTSVLTAIGNDYGFDQVFARQYAPAGGRATSSSVSRRQERPRTCCAPSRRRASAGSSPSGSPAIAADRCANCATT